MPALVVQAPTSIYSILITDDSLAALKKLHEDPAGVKIIFSGPLRDDRNGGHPRVHAQSVGVDVLDLPNFPREDHGVPE
ncbi:hypothetical protein GCM10008096_21370 [Zhihengliuella salsuginis]|uniref:Uncharacterized protein n=2 Tax=Zhihengliuella salsuginis TaxID=578222 RepID=A0ABQ3GJ45_9MICC|nr:hypothetical protein GCM10008096_21370 [Zhihengliuella salsuginis]